MLNKMHKNIGIILFFSVLFLFSGCEKTKKTANHTEEIIPVQVNRIKLQEIDETIDYVGNIKADDEAIVYPKVSGKIIEKVKEDGSVVTKGEVIAYIDRDEVGFKFEKAPVESPLTGIIGRIYVDLGENVTIQTPVALIVNMERVNINFDLPEKYLAKIFLGQEAKIQVDTYPDEVFFGQVTKISPVVDLATRSAPIEITIENKEHKLKSGMFAEVSLIVNRHKNIPVVLKEALIGREPNLYVYVVQNQKAVLKKVKTGIRNGAYFEVTDGLQEGDAVVIMGQQRLHDGAQVKVEEQE